MRAAAPRAHALNTSPVSPSGRASRCNSSSGGGGGSGGTGSSGGGRHRALVLADAALRLRLGRGTTSDSACAAQRSPRGSQHGGSGAKTPLAAVRLDAFKMSPLPRLLAFDLDGTLWTPEMYELYGGAPFRRDGGGHVFDRAGTQVKLMGATANVLRELATDPKWKGTQVAYVSRTEYPEWAIPCLKTFQIADGISMFDVARHLEIYPGSKRTHFRAIQEASGLEYEDMVFYDNERWNISDCSPLGIHCVYTPKGLTDKAWSEGLAMYAAAVEKK